uniref:ISPsy12, transposase OrfB (Tryptophan 2-monooxygenase) n=1 Tax=Ganoderma boninense TaxID=34458 RepID=A0A5K1JSP8_9APHY|nr:ISPsy12, transposase OrfB (Tryptophan 2-monooxygenase) [Ganoderma boninense]
MLAVTRTLRTLLLLSLALRHSILTTAFPIFHNVQSVLSDERRDTKVLILGGGVAGVTAARTLHEQGIDDFIIVEARHELGGRMMSHTFGAAGEDWTVEVGANWVQGTQTGSGPANPIWELAKKHNVSLRSNHDFMSVETYDDSGAVDFQAVFRQSVENFRSLTATAGARVPNQLVDMSARSGYALSGSRPSSRYEMASEYYQFDWEFGATPEETSWLASSWVH